jgi:hypothetical protein
MRAEEFVTEGKSGKMHDHHASATQGAYKFRDDGTDRIYHLNQIMKAAAMSDGKSTKALDMDHESFAGKNNMAYPYTEEEHTMMKQAFNTVSPSDATTLVRDHKSSEPEDTNKVSPHKAFKGYKRK